MEKSIIVEEFNNWNDVKIELDLHGRQPKIAEGQIWWAGVGKNIGAEVYGKNERFARPVLIFRKLGGMNFMVIPISTKEHTGTWFVRFRHQGRVEIALLHQARVMNVKRLYRKIGQIDDIDYARIREWFHLRYCK